jgi:putative PEP-CTERM system TPR-repeat lipoprotein
MEAPMKRTLFSLTRLSGVLLVAGVLSACLGKDPQELIASAQEHIRKNDNAAAIIELKNALQEQSDLPEARLLLGQVLLDNGDPVGAEAELRKAREANFKPDEVAPLLAKAWLMQGQAKKVVEAFDQVQLQTPVAQADLLTWLAIAWRSEGKQDLFRKRLDAALKIQPQHAPALIEQARLFAADGKYDDAIVELSKILAKDRKNGEANKLLGDVLLHGKSNRQDALAAYQAAVASSPRLIDAHVALIRLLMADGKADDAAQALAKLASFAGGHPSTLYLQTQLALQKGDFTLAKEKSQQLLKRTPDSPTANEIAGIIELQAGSITQAQSMLSKALLAAPELQVARRAMILAHLRMGQVDEAIAALPDGFAPEKANADPGLLAAAGRAYMAKGNFPLAQAFFKQAIARDPKDPAKRASLAISQFRSGQTDLALNELAEISSQDSGVVADMALISALMQKREFDRALTAIEKLEQKRAKDPMPKHLRGVALMAKQDREGARKAFEDALAADPDYLAAVAGLAALDLAEKKPDQARSRLEALTQRAPKNAHAWLALADVLQSTGADSEKVVKAIEQAVQAAPTDVRPRVLLVDYQLRRKDHKAALSVAQSALAAFPETPVVVAAMGRSQAAAGELNQAIASFSKLVSLLPESPSAYMLLAGAQSARSEYKTAMQNLSKAMELQSDYLPAQLAYVELALLARQPDEALSIIKKVQQQRPDQAVGYTLEGDMHVSMKRWDAAAAAYRAGLKVSPSPDMAIKLHSVLLASDKHAEAERWAGDWSKAHPKDVAMNMYLGDRFIALHDNQAAAKQYEKVLSLQPKNALALNNLAWLAGQLGRSDAVSLAERANAAAPDQPAFMDTLAMLLSARGEHAKAIELQSKVVKLKPDAPTFKLNLAKIHLKAGDKASAKKLLNEIAALGDKFAGQAEVQRLVKEL